MTRQLKAGNASSNNDQNLKLDYYINLLDRCWIASQHYKDDLNKLLIWQGSLLVGIITITGMFGAVQFQNVLIKFSLTHIILLHCIFAISWLFYLHKKLRAEMYIRIGIEAEKYIKRSIINSEHELNTFFNIRSYYTYPNDRLKLTTSKGATSLIILFYLTLVSVPIFSVKLNQATMSINYETLINVAVFIGIIVVGLLLYKHEEEHVMKAVANEWNNKA